jgi:hypothetical protein
MKVAANKSLAVTGLTVVFIGLAVAFYLDLWDRPTALPVLPLTAPKFTNTTTVRMSAAELFRTGGDTSGMACYSCHDEKKPVVVHLNTNGTVILPDTHRGLVLRHGRSNRNDHCFNCHDPNNVEQLRPCEGQAFKLTESYLWSHFKNRGIPGKWAKRRPENAELSGKVRGHGCARQNPA